MQLFCTSKDFRRGALMHLPPTQASPNLGSQLGEGQYYSGSRTIYSFKFSILLPPFVYAEWGKAGKGVNSSSAAPGPGRRDLRSDGGRRTRPPVRRSPGSVVCLAMGKTHSCRTPYVVARSVRCDEAISSFQCSSPILQFPSYPAPYSGRTISLLFSSPIRHVRCGVEWGPRSVPCIAP